MTKEIGDYILHNFIYMKKKKLIIAVEREKKKKKGNIILGSFLSHVCRPRYGLAVVKLGEND